MAKFTREDLKYLEQLKDKFGTWDAVYRETGLAGRSVRRWKEKLQSQKSVEIEKRQIPRVERGLQLSEKPYFEIDRQVGKASSRMVKKYNLNKGIPQLNYRSFARYDERTGKWYAGKYSNIPEGTEISIARKNQILAGARNQIRKMNKALHFLSSSGNRMSPEECYARANNWSKDYQNFKQELKNVAYQDKNGNWHIGSEGAKLSGRGKGQFISEADVKALIEKSKKIPFNTLDGLKEYLDEQYDLQYSP